MSMQINSNQNIPQNRPPKNVNTVDFKSHTHSGESDKEPSKAVKTGATITTIGAVSLALALIMKKKGFSLAPSKIAKTSPKNWGLWKCDYKEKEIMTIAGSSVAGGLLGGAMFDKKEHMKAKFREAVIQLVGNVSVPLLCVSGGIRLFNKFKPQVLKYIPEIKGSSKLIATSNKALKSIPILVATTGSLIVGILLGNKTGNAINEKVFKVKDDRKIKAADFSPHMDDMCLAISLVSDKNVVGQAISRVIPAALIVAGVSTGVAQEKPERLATKQ